MDVAFGGGGGDVNENNAFPQQEHERKRKPSIIPKFHPKVFPAPCSTVSTELESVTVESDILSFRHIPPNPAVEPSAILAQPTLSVRIGLADTPGTRMMKPATGPIVTRCRNSTSYLDLIPLAQQEPHIREGASVEGVPNRVGFAMGERSTPHNHVVFHEFNHRSGAQSTPVIANWHGQMATRAK